VQLPVANPEDGQVEADHGAGTDSKESCAAWNSRGAPGELHHLEQGCDVLDGLYADIGVAGVGEVFEF
jgi:hypothetical protein